MPYRVDFGHFSPQAVAVMREKAAISQAFQQALAKAPSKELPTLAPAAGGPSQARAATMPEPILPAPPPPPDPSEPGWRHQVIEMKAVRTVNGGFLDWWSDYDVRTANVRDASGDQKLSVKVEAEDSTVTVFDKNGEEIAEIDADGDVDKGDAWKDEYKIELDGENLRSQKVSS